MQSGRLGDVVVVEHSENVPWYRTTHGFVRGNWGNSEPSAPMILTKCCHDIGALFHFRARPCTPPGVAGAVYRWLPR